MSAGFGDITATVNYTDISAGAGGLDGDHTAIGLTYAANGLTVHANWGEFDYTGTAADADGYGLAVNYDLGGGAVIQFGYGSGSTGTAASVDTWSLGLAMSF